MFAGCRGAVVGRFQVAFGVVGLRRRLRMCFELDAACPGALSQPPPVQDLYVAARKSCLRFSLDMISLRRTRAKSFKYCRLPLVLPARRALGNPFFLALFGLFCP